MLTLRPTTTAGRIQCQSIAVMVPYLQFLGLKATKSEYPSSFNSQLFLKNGSKQTRNIK